MEIKQIIIWLILIGVITISYQYFVDNIGLSKVVSEIDGETYKVRDLDDKQEAANYLSKIKIKLEKFVNDLSEEFKENKNIIRLNKKFCSCILFENNPKNGYTTYTQNKCQSMGICIRKNDTSSTVATNGFTDYNTIMFVLMHEFAHIMSINNDPAHITDEFWDNFRFILNQAVKKGIWKYQDYRLNPVPYCGTYIRSVPI